jgi:hypothetical protein
MVYVRFAPKATFAAQNVSHRFVSHPDPTGNIRRQFPGSALITVTALAIPEAKDRNSGLPRK